METRSPKKIIDTVSKIRENTHLLLEKELHRRGIEGIMAAHGSLFAFLFQQREPVPIMSLVKESGRAKSTVTGMLKTLESYGYIRREVSPEDGRSFQIDLTPKGWAIKKDFEEISEMLLRKTYGNMADEDQRYLIRLLTQVEQNLS